ncbi:MAG TPA: GNAT family N-acetyltransferase [Candidatus Limnocylindrales bacterium]|nr:GNAT family N-acetyltransferase [Candidatus Limnocylindrales bacterium]
MRIFEIDPIRDTRWAELVDQHRRASVFHTVGWLEALRRTYGYEPAVFTTSAPDEHLRNGLVFCRVDSWITGRRLVSLPFSDHCEPLCDSAEVESFLIRGLQASLRNRRWRYVELRPTDADFNQKCNGAPFQPVGSYSLHRLDLRPELNCIFRSLDKDSVQRRIQRAHRANLVEKCGRSAGLLKEFYDLFVKTRRRHGLPPIPYRWFENLIAYQGEALEIRLAYKDETPITAILTLKFRDVIYYKYGCSDLKFNKFGAMPWLLWKAIAAGKLAGASEFDMGRTEGGGGLLAFKNHWVPHPERLVYWKYPQSPIRDTLDRWKLGVAKRVFSRMPERLLTMTGELIYRHMG